MSNLFMDCPATIGITYTCSFYRNFILFTSMICGTILPVDVKKNIKKGLKIPKKLKVNSGVP